MADSDPQSYWQALSGLHLLLVVALVLTFARPLPRWSDSERDHFQRLFLLAVAGQCFHLVEELWTGFAHRFPQLFGLAPMPTDFFVTFNVVWIGIWLGAWVLTSRNVRVAYWPIWFFALGMLANGIAHPLLTLWVGGYFPGLITSPGVGLFGFLLLRRLLAATSEELKESS